jgi:hypothetical protein
MISLYLIPSVLTTRFFNESVLTALITKLFTLESHLPLIMKIRTRDPESTKTLPGGPAGSVKIRL